MKKIFYYLSFILCVASCSTLEDQSNIVVEPTSLSVLSNRVLIGPGSTNFIEFRINPMKVAFNFDILSSNCEMLLDRVGTTRTFDGKITPPQHYKLSKIEHVQGDSGIIKEGQYRAYITDLKTSETYDDLVALVLIITNENGERIQISSSAFEIKCSGNSLTDFKFLKQDNDSTWVINDVIATIENNNINVYTPYIFSKTNLVATFSTNGEKVFVGNEEQISGISSNDYSKPVKYTVVSNDGKKRNYTVTLKNSGLPVVFINTPDAVDITSRTEWIQNCDIKIVQTNGLVEFYGEKMQMKGRGNTTWDHDKKPYTFKLDNKAEILDMPAHKRWVLLANAYDGSLIKNAVAFQIAHYTDLEWTPHGRFVELILNGKHKGNYYLCEQIKIDKNRVNINKMPKTATTGEDITGGYLMEMDVAMDEVNNFRSAYFNMPYMFKEPDEEDINKEQLAYMINYVNEMEYALYDETKFANHEYLNYMDIDSYIDWWFVYELTQNDEPCKSGGYPKSCYTYKDKNGKMKMGPVWDFDLFTFDSDRINTFAVKDAIYYGRLFQDSTFVSRVKERWSKYYDKFLRIPPYIQEKGDQIRESSTIDKIIWGTSHVWTDSWFEGELELMKSVYTRRFIWLDDQISKM